MSTPKHYLSTTRFPTLEQLDKKPTVQPCSLVLELAEAGLRDHELLIEQVWTPDEDDGDDDEVWPSYTFSIRRQGTKEWHPIGDSDEGYNFAHCRGAGASLMCYFTALEEFIEEAFDAAFEGEESDC